MTSPIHRTPLYHKHLELNAKMVEFGGWEMPLQYPLGIINEHLATRNAAGLFEVSHMGRFTVRGEQGLEFLQSVLSNNAAALEPGLAQYTMIPDRNGGAIDDAYLFRLFGDEYLLVVNAANREKDWEYFQSVLVDFDQVELIDKTEATAMLSLQGPASEGILSKLIGSGSLPESKHNQLSMVAIKNAEVLVARTGYTGEPICFELVMQSEDAIMIWDELIASGAVPVGLGARDTLRLEAGLPLYGHELGVDIEGMEIPVFACPLARFAVSFSPEKGDYPGKEALARQHNALEKIKAGDFSARADLPRVLKRLEVKGRAVARPGARVFSRGGEEHIGYVTSGTVIPSLKNDHAVLTNEGGEEKILTPICLALLDSNHCEGETVEIEIRGRMAAATIMPYRWKKNF